MKQQKTMGAYYVEKCLSGYGIINGIINAGIFYAMEAAHPDALFGRIDSIANIAVTAFILGIILYYCAVPLTKKDLVANKFSVDGAPSALGARFPKSGFASALLVGVAALVLGTALAALVTFVVPTPLSLMQMVLFKGCLCAIVGAFAGYLTITKTVYAYSALPQVDAPSGVRPD